METTTKNEVNQSTEGVAIHDIIILSKYQKTGEDGKKLGYSFYEKNRIGVVTQTSEDKITMKMGNGSFETYCSQDVDKDYYYRIGKGSEVEYEKDINDEIKNLVKARDQKNEEIAELTDWLSTFNFTISVLGRIARFIKEFKV